MEDPASQLEFHLERLNRERRLMASFLISYEGLVIAQNFQENVMQGSLDPLVESIEALSSKILEQFELLEDMHLLSESVCFVLGEFHLKYRFLSLKDQPTLLVTVERRKKPGMWERRRQKKLKRENRIIMECLKNVLSI